jgi:threonine dehydrogenase-like Zn-dependent dehydrogenase
MQSIAVTPSARRVSIIDQPAPKLSGPTAVMLRMLEVGVCGTDREICAFQ